MRKFLKKNILEIVKTIYEAHIVVKDLIDKKEYEKAQNLLADCQDAVIELGDYITESEGEGFITVSYLEEYCKELYEIAITLSEKTNGYKVQKQLDKKLIKIENSVKYDIKVKLEIVFMPYKASMWDSLESVWKVANEDSNCNAYVVPIPYYDRNPDQTFGQFHYEGNEYPDYVPVVHYESYNLEQRRPDVICIHNPYDANNRVTSVDPKFYSNILKKYTECLVYIPYFMFPKLIETHALTRVPVLFSADVIITQNEQVKKAYENEMKMLCDSGYNLKGEVLALGTPKTDKIVNVCRSENNIPEKWVDLAKNKKKIFLNTNLNLIFNNNEGFIGNMNRIFAILNKRDDVFVIWREHPLTNETLKSMKPGMISAYKKLKEKFVKSGLGVLDTNAEAYEAICFSDCYFGAGGSLAPIYAVTGKPMLLTVYKYPDNLSNEEVPFSFLLKQAEKSYYFAEKYGNFLDMFLDNLENLMEYKNERLEILSKITLNADGTVGTSIMNTIKERLEL